MKKIFLLLICIMSSFSLFAEKTKTGKQVKFDLPDQKLSLVYKKGNFLLFCPPQVGRTTNLKKFRNGNLPKFLTFANPTKEDQFKKFKELPIFRDATYEIIAQQKEKEHQTIRLRGLSNGFPFEIDFSIHPDRTTVVIIMRWPKSKTNGFPSEAILSMAVLESVGPDGKAHNTHF